MHLIDDFRYVVFHELRAKAFCAINELENLPVDRVVAPDLFRVIDRSRVFIIETKTGQHLVDHVLDLAGRQQVRVVRFAGQVFT